MGLQILNKLREKNIITTSQFMASLLGSGEAFHVEIELRGGTSTSVHRIKHASLYLSDNHGLLVRDDRDKILVVPWTSILYIEIIDLG